MPPARESSEYGNPAGTAAEARLAPLRRAAEELEETVLRYLHEHPDGTDEHTLLGALRAAGAPLPEGSLSDSLVLFQCHFLLFHALYRLRDRLRADAEAELEFGPLRIALRPYAAGDTGLADADPLRAYYLDLENLVGTSAKDVEDLLGGFWRRYQAFDGRGEALSVLGLEADADWPAVRARYKRLAMRHHPDRGGDGETLQAIHAAMATLRACYTGE